ncbi:hypothetical protein [Oceanicola sp. S124]|uniref:hypothetical protein n=1 Tax=Oceanicola sp. S124 TaxID=1042378 RepID=UPI0002557E2D|nr:hypothetical protein [Oceanicola sp. S124]
MTQHSQSEFHAATIEPAVTPMNAEAEAQPASWAPPEAPLAMPRQQLEREGSARRRFGLFAGFRQTAA